jgi:hypothetical protein
MPPAKCLNCDEPVGDFDSCEICDEEICGYCLDDHMEEYHGSGGDEW